MDSHERYGSLDDLLNAVKPALQIEDGRLEGVSPETLRGEVIDRLVFNAVFNEEEPLQALCRWAIREAAGRLGLWPSSIQGLYRTWGRGECDGFTVPALNLRGITFDAARAVFRAAKTKETGAFIFEIARSEIGYTGQRPSEYATVILAAGIKEGFQGPVFLQGDHFQACSRAYRQNPESEVENLRVLIREAIAAGFFNIDIDASTLVELDKPSIEEQQRLNCLVTAELTREVRHHEPKDITISVGGEIGEVGGKNSTVEELRAFMDGYLKELNQGGKLNGVSKISVQTGTTHGGVVLPDGSIAKVKLDFEVLRKLSALARQDYGMAGAVQHGASTLPEEAFGRFPQVEAAEVHLATEFQNMIYESPAFPSGLREEIYHYLRENLSGERKEGQTDEQFHYQTRKKAFGPFKEPLWSLPHEIRSQIARELETKFSRLFEKLGVIRTRRLIEERVPLVETHLSFPPSGRY